MDRCESRLPHTDTTRAFWIKRLQPASTRSTFHKNSVTLLSRLFLTIQTWALNGLAGTVVCLDMCLSRWLGGDWQRDKGKPQARLSIALSLLSYLWHLLMLAHMIQPESHFQNIKLCTTLLFVDWWKSEQLLIYFDLSYVIEWTIGSAAALDWFKLLN